MATRGHCDTDSMVTLSRSEIGHLADLLVTLKAEHGTVAKVARELDVPADPIGKILHRVAVLRVSPATLEGLERHFGCSRADLLAGRASQRRAG